MRKHHVPALLVITVVFAAFILGFFLGRTQNGDEISVSVPDALLTVPTAPPETTEISSEETEGIRFPISINDAGKEEFMALPGIGEVLAERIVAFREENGNFSVPEELLNVEGIGKKRLEEILDLITIGG